MAKSLALQLLMVSTVSAVVPSTVAESSTSGSWSARSVGAGAAFLSPPHLTLRTTRGGVGGIIGSPQQRELRALVQQWPTVGVARWEEAGREAKRARFHGAVVRRISAQDFQDLAMDVPYLFEALQQVLANALEHKEETARAIWKFHMQRWTPPSIILHPSGSRSTQHRAKALAPEAHHP